MPPRPPLGSLLERASHAPILPVPQRSTGNNVPHSMHKTRRAWHANVRRYNLPVNVLGGALNECLRIDEQVAIAGPSKRPPQYPQFNKVKMTARGMKSVEKAGGVEAMLVSRPSKHFTAYGKQLRHELFNDLRKIRDEIRYQREQERTQEEQVPRIE